MNSGNQERFNQLLQVSHQISQTRQLENSLSYKRQLGKFLEKLNEKECVKSYSNILVYYLQQAIQNTQNWTLQIQKQIICIVIKFLSYEQSYVCESLMLCNSIIDFMKFILTQPIDDVYTIKLIGNLFGLVYLHEQIFDIQIETCQQLDMKFNQLKLQNKISIFSDKPLQTILRELALQNIDMALQLSKFELSEFKTLIFEIAAISDKVQNLQIEQGEYKNPAIVHNMHILSCKQQVEFYLYSDKLDISAIEILIKIMYSNKESDFSEFATVLINQILNSDILTNNREQERILFLLRLICKQSKFNLTVSTEYQNIRNYLVKGGQNDNQKRIFIVEILGHYVSNLEEILQFEISQNKNNNNITTIVVQLINSTHFNFLIQFLIQQSITAYQLILLHILILVSDISYDFSQLEENCNQFELSDMYLVQLYSFYSISDLNYKRKVKLLNQFQSLLHSVDNYTFIDVLSILGIQTSQNKSKNKHLSNILSQNWNDISLYIQKIDHHQKQSVIQGFYHIVMYFTDPKDCEFLILYNIIHKAMCNRNRGVNLQMLLQSLKNYTSTNLESQIDLYVMLLKLNYILDNKVSIKKQNEDISEYSSEFGTLEQNDEREKLCRSEIQIEGEQVLHEIEKRIKMLEITKISKVTQDQKAYNLLIIYRLMQLSSVTVEYDHDFMKKLEIITNKKLDDSQIIWESLQNQQLVPLATTVIKIFKNESELVTLKMIGAELNKLVLEKRVANGWSSYDIMYLQDKQNPNQSDALSKSLQLKYAVMKYQLMLNFHDNFNLLMIAYEQCEKSKLEMTALLIAISLHCGISNNLIQKLGELNNICVNLLLVKLSQAGFLKLVLKLLNSTPQTLNSKIKRKSKSKNKQMEIENQLETLLEDDKIINFQQSILISIQKNIIRNQDLQIELIHLAELIYRQPQLHDYSLILQLFNRCPTELLLLCLQSINNSVPKDIIDAKLQHCLLLLQQVNKAAWQLLDPKAELHSEAIQFYELSFSILTDYPEITVTMINYSYQLISMIKLKDNDEIMVQNDKVIDFNQLKEILIPEQYQAQSCTQSQSLQHIYVYTNSQGKQIRCCANCVFSCYQQYFPEYEGIVEAQCQCGINSKKCQQQKNIKQIKQLKTQSYRPYFFDAMNIDIGLKKQMYELRMGGHGDDRMQQANLWTECDSDKDIEESASSSQIQLMEESVEIPDILDSEQSSKQQIEEIQQITKQNDIQQKHSENLKKLNINLYSWQNKLIQMSLYAIQNAQNNCNNKESNTNEYEFQLNNVEVLPEMAQNSEQLILSDIPLKHTVDLYSDLKNNHDLIQRKQTVHFPFIIRKALDTSDNFVALGSTQQELRLYPKNKFTSIIEKKQSNLQVGYTKLNLKYALESVSFNPFNNAQLLICGFLDIHLLELKPDGTQQSEKTIITRSPQIISKVLWVSQFVVSWLVGTQIVILNIQSGHRSEYMHSQDGKWKDYFVLNDSIVMIDFSSNIYQSKIQEIGRVPVVQQIKIPENLKGTSVCLTLIPNTTFILGSFKQGSSFLCQFLDNQLKNIVRLDQALTHLKMDSLLCNPQLIGQSQTTLQFAVLAQKHNAGCEQLNFHRGKLIIIQINNKGNLIAQLYSESIVDSYIIVQENNEIYSVCIHDKQMSLIHLNTTKEFCNNINFEVKVENHDLLLNQLSEQFDLSLVSEGSQIFPPLQNFCLSPNVQATPQQYQIGPSSITVSAGYCISGIVFLKSQNEQIEIFKSRTIQRKNQNLIVPFNYLEQLYTYLHHTVEFSQVKATSVQVYVQKMHLSKALIQKILQILNNQNQQSKIYSYSELDGRINQFQNLVSDEQIVLINSLDCLGITLMAQNIKVVDQTLVQQLIDLIEKDIPHIRESAKRLLRILLTNRTENILMGNQFHYKTIMDRIFIEKVSQGRINNKNQILQKLIKIGIHRLPQLFYIFHSQPQLITDLFCEQVITQNNQISSITQYYDSYSILLIQYMTYLLNCKQSVNDILNKIEIAKNSWSLSNQNLFNFCFQNQIINSIKQIDTQITYDYQWNIFAQPQQMEEEFQYLSEDKSDQISEYFDQVIEIEFNQPNQSIQINQPNQLQKQLPSPKEVQLQSISSIMIQSYDLPYIYSQWLICKINKCNSTLGNADSTFQEIKQQNPQKCKEIQNLVILINQLYVVIKSCCKHTYNSNKIIKLMNEIIDCNTNQYASAIILTFINSPLLDSFWNYLKNNMDCYLVQQDILNSLNEISIAIQFGNNYSYIDYSSDKFLKNNNQSLDKLRILLKDLSNIPMLNQQLKQQRSNIKNESNNDNVTPQIAKQLCRIDQIQYVQLLNYLLNQVNSSEIQKQQFQNNREQWSKFLFQAQLNQQIKQIASSQIKALLQLIVNPSDYHITKDYNLYQSQFDIIKVNAINNYGQKQRKYQALELMLKTAKKREEIWRKYYCENIQVKQLLKQMINYAPALEMIEMILG